MGSPKALLSDDEGHPFVVRIARSLAEAGLADITIVTGTAHEGIVAALTADPPPVVPTIVRNPDPSRGQLSSLWVGMDAAIGPDTEGILMTLVDVPMVTAATIRVVIDRWRATRAPIVRPAIGVRHGHPVIFDRALFAALRAAPLESGAKVVIDAHAARVLNVPVDDRGSLIDVDTPDDYQSLRRSGMSNGLPPIG